MDGIVAEADDRGRIGDGLRVRLLSALISFLFGRSAAPPHFGFRRLRFSTKKELRKRGKRKEGKLIWILAEVIEMNNLPSVSNLMVVGLHAHNFTSVLLCAN